MIALRFALAGSLLLFAPATLAQGRHGEPEPLTSAPGDRRVTTENLWRRNPAAPRWGHDFVLGPTLGPYDLSWSAKGSSRYAIVPWVSFGLSGGYLPAVVDPDPLQLLSTPLRIVVVEPARVNVGAFFELHLLPGAIVDPWFRFTAGCDFVVESRNAYNDRAAALVFRETSFGVAFGGGSLAVGPYVSSGPIVAEGHRRPGFGLRIDLTPRSN